VTVESSFSDDLALARQLAALASEVALGIYLTWSILRSGRK
jgi:hypothetical protein